MLDPIYILYMIYTEYIDTWMG